jgi:hypothetical protein
MNNFNPKLWGKSSWDFLFYSGLAYPDNPTKEDKENMEKFLLYMGNILPCRKCRFNFKNHLVKYPINNNVLSCRYNLINWMINIYNEICKINNNNKLMCYNDVIERYMNNRNNNYINNKLLFSVITIFIIFSLILLIRLSKK